MSRSVTLLQIMWKRQIVSFSILVCFLVCFGPSGVVVCDVAPILPPVEQEALVRVLNSDHGEMIKLALSSEWQILGPFKAGTRG